ncbi:MAG: hypothetical protein H7178_11205 [Chitinophagaceae bacterium]|nr:hypothetical protein [Chitinophagaceae bacterium]
MKKIFLLLLAASALINFTSCKKAVEAAKEQAVVDAITDGTWYVSAFTQSGNDITASFAGWEFIYYSNNTSIANKAGSASIPGTWSGDAATLSFTATFTGMAPEPLPKLAGTWLVTRAVSTNKGNYARTVAGVNYTMELTKK